MRIAALLHDIGHYPYSHLMEYVDRDKHRPGYLSKPKKNTAAQPEKVTRYPDHEKIGQLAITKRADVSEKLRAGGVDPDEIASIIRGQHAKPAYNQLIHSSLDMDRMDYMVRDSLGTGVPYGRIDLHYLLSNLDVTDDGEIVVSYKAAAAAEHFVVARYFMYKSVYMHKTIFGFEALLRHILFLLREHGEIPTTGEDIEALVLTDDFLRFHDGYVDDLDDKFAAKQRPKEVVPLCQALRLRKPPKLVHEVAALTNQAQGAPAEYALFTKDRSTRIKALQSEFGIEASRWIWAALRVLFDHLERHQTVIILDCGAAAKAGGAPDYALALEKYLEDLLVEGWDSLDWGAPLEYIGRQVPAGDLGFIDILARDRDTGAFVVIELKRDLSDDEVVGQLSRYMDWIKEHRALPAAVTVRGIIVVHHITPRLRSAVLAHANVRLCTYDLAITIQQVGC